MSETQPTIIVFHYFKRNSITYWNCFSDKDWYFRGTWFLFWWMLLLNSYIDRGFPGGSVVKESACNAGDPGSVPGLGRSPGEGNSNPFQYSCLENSMDRGAWQAIVHGLAESQTRLSNFTFTFSLYFIFKPTLPSGICGEVWSHRCRATGLFPAQR